MRGDLREGGTWTTAQAAKNGAIWLAASAILWVLSRATPRFRAWCCRAAARATFTLARGLRATSIANLSLVYPTHSKQEVLALARRCFERIGANLASWLERLSAPSTAVEPLPTFDPDGLARLRALAESARGVVLVSAHLGDWESVARAIVAAKIPFVAVGREPYDPRLRAWFDRLRDDTPIIYRGSAGAATRMMRVLKTGGVLGVPMDLRARVPSVPARFFGQLAWTAVGPARLCLRTRAHLVAVSLERTDAGERITCTSIPTLAAPPTGAARDLDARERALTQAINDELERRIRSMPEAWLWPHERFHPSPPLPERARK